MKHNLFLSLLAAALMSSGVANAETLLASDYEGDQIDLCSDGSRYDKLVVNVPLTLTGELGYLFLGYGASIEFQKKEEDESICSICTPEELWGDSQSVFFELSNDFTFDEGAQAIIAASAGTPITLIQDLNMQCKGFGVVPTSTLKLNSAGYGETVVLNGVSFTYVGPKEDEAAIMQGQIGFIGYENGSHNLSLVAKTPAVPEPTTGSLSLLALAGLCARRRK